MADRNQQLRDFIIWSCLLRFRKLFKSVSKIRKHIHEFFFFFHNGKTNHFLADFWLLISNFDFSFLIKTRKKKTVFSSQQRRLEFEWTIIDASKNAWRGMWLGIDAFAMVLFFNILMAFTITLLQVASAYSWLLSFLITPHFSLE